MKLETGKTYRARGGVLVDIVGKSHPGNNDAYKFLGQIKGSHSGWWCEDGRYDITRPMHEYDLIEEVPAANPIDRPVDLEKYAPGAQRVELPQRATYSVLDEVREERQRQDNKWGGADHDDCHPAGFWPQLIQDYAGWARVMLGMDADRYRRRMIQVAALAVAAVEACDRHYGRPT